MKIKNPHAVALGRKGGKVVSTAKKASGRINAAKATAARVAKRQPKLSERKVERDEYSQN